MSRLTALTEGDAGLTEGPDRESTVPARVAKALQQMICDQGLKPGDALPSQRELVTLLQASRPSVREGISMLEMLGIIRVEGRRGLFVANGDGQRPIDFWPFHRGYDLREVYQFRIGFEPDALALAFSRLTSDALQRLRHHAEALMIAARQGNAVVAAEQDTAFHDVIFEYCGNRIFLDIRSHLSKAMKDSQWVPMVIIERVGDTAREHLAIVDALEAGNCADACAALRDHIHAAALRCDLHLT
ncbi:FadR family transcriptional regulator [Roseibium polysiphoniae]|uniref:FadR family transcriptional regulator n=1 Tax=Roseibium polysiphoniae TaxID=2571221 RepID=A0A944GRG8_9HYPH|nr:FadR family transcriptional regulator [Roseibium polysiphoniae]